MQYIAYKFTAYTHAFMVDKLLLHVCHKHHNYRNGFSLQCLQNEIADNSS
jgi:hypothetical protein